MKTRLLFILFSCIGSTCIFSQSYRPFPESNAYWIEEHAWLYPSGCSGYTYHQCTDPVYFGNDTVINSMVYHTLYYRQVCSAQQTIPPPPNSPCPWITYYNIPPATFAFIRQDSIARKVFIYDTVTNQDTLLYDFNISVGNPLPHTYNNPMYPNVIVSSIDSVLLTDGYHLRYNLNLQSPTDSASIIEGIGSTFGLITPLVVPFENSDRLICFSENNITIYPNASAICDFNVGITPVENEQALNIYPNPSEDFILIRNNFASSLSVTVFSSHATVVYQATLAKDVEATIDLSGWANGIYMVTAVSGKNFISRKVIKQ